MMTSTTKIKLKQDTKDTVFEIKPKYAVCCEFCGEKFAHKCSIYPHLKKWCKKKPSNDTSIITPLATNTNNVSVVTPLATNTNNVSVIAPLTINNASMIAPLTTNKNISSEQELDSNYKIQLDEKNKLLEQINQKMDKMMDAQQEIIKFIKESKSNAAISSRLNVRVHVHISQVYFSSNDLNLYDLCVQILGENQTLSLISQSIIVKKANDRYELGLCREKYLIKNSNEEIKTHPPKDEITEIKTHPPKDYDEEIKTHPPKDYDQKIERHPPKDYDQEIERHSPKGNTQEIETSPPKGNTQEIKTHPPRDNTLEIKTHLSKDNTQEIKTHLSKDNTQEIKTHLSKDNTQEIKTHPPKDDTQEIKTHPPRDNAQEVKTHPPRDNAQVIKTHPPRDNAQVIKTHLPRDNAQVIKTHPPRDNTQEIQTHSSKVKKYIPITLKVAVWDQYIGKDIPYKICPICQINEIRQTNFECGHLLAKNNGGLIDIKNLRPICGQCNKSMGTKHMKNYVLNYFPNAPILSIL